ncbi:hypothetical protein BAE44_0005012, partial [Dichanthelium oligosanthes]
LLVTQFFITCKNHRLSSRSECNLFCIECEAPTAAFCYYCRSDHHPSHRIRRSSYHDVVKVSELEDILDISDVQTYVINGARVVFLNERAHQGPSGSSSSSYNCVVDGNGSHSNTSSNNEMYDDNEEEPPAKRVARHRRKGIPERAPFF